MSKEKINGTVWIKLEDAKAAVDAVSFNVNVTGPKTSESFVQEVAQVICDACRKDIKERLDKIEDQISVGFDIVNGEIMITDAEQVFPAYEDET